MSDDRRRRRIERLEMELLPDAEYTDTDEELAMANAENAALTTKLAAAEAVIEAAERCAASWDRESWHSPEDEWALLAALAAYRAKETEA